LSYIQTSNIQPALEAGQNAILGLFMALVLLKSVWTTWGTLGKDKAILENIYVDFNITMQELLFQSISAILARDYANQETSSQMNCACS